MKRMRSHDLRVEPFAPPFLEVDGIVLAQTAAILAFLGPRLHLVPDDEESRLHANQLALTIADLVAEVHDTHHPIAGALYYADQKPEAARRSAAFVRDRIPKYLGYLERVLGRAGGEHFLGSATSYVDLSMFQVIAGLRYAFPRAMARVEPTVPRIVALHDAVAKRPRLSAYLASNRRVPFNEDGIFRRYPELDVDPG
jgi:glutathione S-transferase